MNYNKIPSEFTKNLPIEEALKLLNFRYQSDTGMMQRKWDIIKVDAGPWIWNWALIISIERRTADTIYMPQQLCVGLTMRPIDILVIIYCACDSLFRKENPPEELALGKLEWERLTTERRKEYERRPKVWAERDFFRFCLTYLEKRNDWIDEDYEVEFSHGDGQLKLKAKDDIVFCPAIGTFNGNLTMWARQLFRRLPKRFLGPTVFIQVLKEQKASINSQLFNACWVEKPAISKGGDIQSIQKGDEHSPLQKEVSTSKTFGSENEIFTEDKANRTREILSEKLPSIHTDFPIDQAPEAVDLSTKSTHELVDDAFKIINKHIRESGISGKSKEND